MGQKNKGLALRWLLVLGWMGLIFVLSHQEGNQSASLSGDLLRLLGKLGFTPAQIEYWRLHFFVRKAAHFSEYFILTLLLLWSLPDRFGRKRAAMLALFVAVVYALTDEWHQSFVPKRTAAWFDVWVDAAGSFFALLWYGALRWFFPSKTK